MAEVKRRQDPLWLRSLLIMATVLILFLLIVLPILRVFEQAFGQGMAAYVRKIFANSETRHSLFLTAMVAPTAVALNTIFGTIAAYILARFRFWGRDWLLALIDLPFSVSPVVTGFVLILLYGKLSWLGSTLAAQGYQIIFAPPGLVLATMFVTFPFVIRELIPVLESQGPEEELAARSLGASAWQMFRAITLPNIRLGLLYAVVLCHARAMGEFGAVYVVSGRITGRTDTVPLRIEKLYQDYDTTGAMALASILTGVALVSLVLKRILEEQMQRQPRNLPPERGAEPIYPTEFNSAVSQK